MSKHKATLPVGDSGGKFDVELTYEMEKNTGIKITSAEDDDGKKVDLTPAQKLEVLEALRAKHPDQDLPPIQAPVDPNYGVEAPAEPPAEAKPVDPAAPKA